MRKYTLFFVMLIVISGLFLMPTAAQQPTDDTCPPLFLTSLNAIGNACVDIGRNSACYGNLDIQAEAVNTMLDFEFDSIGDVEDVAKFKQMRLSELDPDANVWGVALMNLQANLPGSLPGQGVTVLLFGDVELTPDYIPVVLPATVASAGAVNVRGGPATTFDVIGTLNGGETLRLTGRNEAGDWLRLEWDEDEGTSGWIANFLASSSEDLTALNVVEADAPAYHPMQAFTFRSGIGDAACLAMPDSGIMIQTPQGAREILLKVNGVDVRVGSTIYMQAQPDGYLTIYVVEGHITVTGEGVTQVAPEGTLIRVPIDENMTVNGAPEPPEPYTTEQVEPLTDMIVLLPDDIAMSEPYDPEELEAYLASANACTLSPIGTPNIRRGPGIEYPILTELSRGDRRVREQATGTDSMTWYRIGTAGWIREDVVTTEGNCESVDVLAELPPVPTAVPVVNSGSSSGGSSSSSGGRGTVIYDIWYHTGQCNPYGHTIYAGQTVQFQWGCCGAPDLAEQAAREARSGSPSISLDGGGLPISVSEPFWSEGGGGAWYTRVASAPWIATAGTHTVTATWGMSLSCTIDVQP